jgi:hypothetical protein
MYTQPTACWLINLNDKGMSADRGATRLTTSTHTLYCKMPLQIPKQHVPAILKIRALSDAVTEKLIDALASSPFTQVPDKMAKRIAVSVPDISSKDLKAIVETVYALHNVREFSEVTASRFLTDLVQAVRAGDDSNSPLDRDEASRLRDRFKRMLDIEKMGSKA